jgi:hypothetical protein
MLIAVHDQLSATLIHELFRVVNVKMRQMIVDGAGYRHDHKQAV